MELVRFIGQDVNHFFGTIFFIIIAGMALRHVINGFFRERGRP